MENMNDIKDRVYSKKDLTFGVKSYVNSLKSLKSFIHLKRFEEDVPNLEDMSTLIKIGETLLTKEDALEEFALEYINIVNNYKRAISIIISNTGSNEFGTTMLNDVSEKIQVLIKNIKANYELDVPIYGKIIDLTNFIGTSKATTSETIEKNEKKPKSKEELLKTLEKVDWRFIELTIPLKNNIIYATLNDESKQMYEDTLNKLYNLFIEFKRNVNFDNYMRDYQLLNTEDLIKDFDECAYHLNRIILFWSNISKFSQKFDNNWIKKEKENFGMFITYLNNIADRITKGNIKRCLFQVGKSLFSKGKVI